MIIEIIQIILLLVTSLISSVSDLISGKISNKLIFYMLIIASCTDIAMFTFFYRDGLKTFFINVAIITVISIFLYITHVWAGGDCKLLIVLSLLFPANRYWIVNNSQFTLWISLMFTFMIGFMYLIAESIVLLIKEKPKFQLKSLGKSLYCRIISYLRIIVYVVAINHIYCYFILPRIVIPTAVYICISIIIVWRINKSEITKSKILVGAFLVFDLLMTLFTGVITVSLAWKTYLLVVIFMILRILIEKYNYQVINVDNVKEGMILSRTTTLCMQKSRVKGLPLISDETLKSRLNEDEVYSIHKWKNSKYGMKSIVIVRKIPFAIFISFGLILYLIIGSIL